MNLDLGIGNYDPTEIAAYNPWIYVNPTQYLKQDAGDGVIYASKGVTAETLKNYVGIKDNTGVNVDTWNYNLELNGNYDLNSEGTYQVWVTARTNNGLATQKQYTMVIMQLVFIEMTPLLWYNLRGF